MISVPLTFVLLGGAWPIPPPPTGETCVASYYGDRFAGRTTASGSTFDPSELVAAHRTLPFGTVLEVTGPDGSVEVEVVDRGPFVDGRCVDLSEAAFGAVADLSDGLAEVIVRRDLTDADR